MDFGDIIWWVFTIGLVVVPALIDKKMKKAGGDDQQPLDEDEELEEAQMKESDEEDEDPFKDLFPKDLFPREMFPKEVFPVDPPKPVTAPKPVVLKPVPPMPQPAPKPVIVQPQPIIVEPAPKPARPLASAPNPTVRPETSGMMSTISSSIIQKPSPALQEKSADSKRLIDDRRKLILYSAIMERKFE